MPDKPPLTAENTLGYQSRIPATASHVFQAASNALLLLGGLSILTGTCLSGYMLAIQSAFGGETSPKGPYGLEAMSAADCLLVTGVLLAPATIGIVEILCGLKARMGSRKSAIVATVLVAVQATAVIVVGGLYYARAPSIFQPGIIATAAFVGILALTFWSLFLLARVFR